MLYEMMALSDRGGGGRRQYGGGRRGDRYGGPGRAARNSGGKGATGNGRNDFDQIEWRDSRYMGKRGGRESVVESPWSTLTIYNNEGLLSVIISD